MQITQNHFKKLFASIANFDNATQVGDQEVFKSENLTAWYVLANDQRWIGEIKENGDVVWVAIEKANGDLELVGISEDEFLEIE